MVDSLVDLWQFRWQATGNFELEKPYEIPQNRTSLGIKFAKKDMVSFLRFTFDCMCLSGHLSMSIHEMTRARQTCLKSTFPMPAW